MKKILNWNTYLEAAARAASEGIVILKNENQTLPIEPGKTVALFGRIQLHYYKSGTGSGGMVNVSKVTGILEGLRDNGVNIQPDALAAYQKWDEENPFDVGEGWGREPWSQKEMPLDEELVKKAAQDTQTAIVIIGRTAGEEQDNQPIKGAYMLSEEEERMMRIVRDNFEKMAVLLNVGNIIDMRFMDDICPDAVMYVWQGGMTGGTGTADVLTGKVSPSGKLSDTIAYDISDYPSNENFGDSVRNFYKEDIYMGYRYFETFAKEKVRFPFGYGLSYSTFEINTHNIESDNEHLALTATVKNTGNFKGKEVVQVYCEAPQGRLGKPLRVLCGFVKTKELAPGEAQTVKIKIPLQTLASYDDSGITGYGFCWVMEEGSYKFYVGTDVRNADYCGEYALNKTTITKRLEQALTPVRSFNRIRPKNLNGKTVSDYDYEPVPLYNADENKRRIERLPEEIPVTGDRGIRLEDVYNKKHTMNEFIAQFSDYDLSCIIRGEGMGSPKVTAGTASAFGGVSEGLQQYGIPCACCSDGPSGMRLDCGTKAFSLPNGTMLACTFNEELIEELFSLLGMEMSANKVDCLLGPGMNLHRHPLNGRNFEYFSEDPFLTGKIAAAELKGMHKSGVTGTLKHFCGNNQEAYRHDSDSVISERALRELYLKGFEIAVKEGDADSVMTTYGSVNGLWTAGSYDLTTTILRDEWGFEGIVMTDWWANINVRGKAPDKRDFAAMARAQNDIYMVCSDGADHDDNTLSALENGTLTRAELQRNAKNICSFLLRTNAMQRIMGNDTRAEITGRPDDKGDISGDDVVFYELDKTLDIPLSGISAEKGTYHAFALDIKIPGRYKVTVTASSQQSELAQIPLTLFCMGTAYGTFTWNGTGGKPVSLSRTIPMFSRFTTFRLYFAQNGLKLHDISFELTETEIKEIPGIT